MKPRASTQRRQAGATLIEFALGLIIFLTFFLGIMDFSRMLWTWGAANEATRWGARTAVVCDKNAPAVLSNMQKFLPQLGPDNLQIDWYTDSGLNNACTATTLPPNTCTAVHVRITNLDYQWISPIGWTAGKAIPMPQFSTFLPRESMGRDADGNIVCS